MELNQQTAQLLSILIFVVSYVVKAWLQKKDADVAKKAEAVQNMVLEAISKARTMDKGGAKEALKQIAVDHINKQITDNPTVTSAIKSLSVSIKEEDISDYIETALHGAKLGLNNVLKDKFKALK